MTVMGDFKVETKPCRSCGRPIIWATVLASGKRMPVNASPTTPYGNIVLFLRRQEGREDMVVAKVVKEGAPLKPGEQLRTSHFSDCPAAELHRQERQDQAHQRGQLRFGIGQRRRKA